MNAVLSITSDKWLLQQIKEGYDTNPWCKKLPLATQSWPDLQLKEGLWYVGTRLIIPHTGALHEALFQLAHDSLGHFGFDKTYGSLRSAYYCPNMRRDLEKGYVVSCPECQHNKSTHQNLLVLSTHYPFQTNMVIRLPLISLDRYLRTMGTIVLSCSQTA